jgi:hypothetical protein
LVIPVRHDTRAAVDRDAYVRRLREAAAAEDVQRRVADWAPLTPEQRARLAVLLHPVAEGESDAT